MSLKPKIHYSVFFLSGLVYAIFQTRNAMIDSWYYASCVKYGQELFNSHHLLYNYFGLYWFSLLKLIKPSVEAIVALNLLNAFSASASLFILYGCLKRLKNDADVSFWLTMFCGASFCFMRYATDAETYVLPLLFSLVSTYFFISPGYKNRLFVSGLFAAVAILIHQLHVWWFIAMFVFLLTEKPFKIRPVLLFGLPALLIPLTYYLAFLQNRNQLITFTQFFTGEYSKGNASIDISITSFLLTIVNLIRTIIQVHGQVIFLFQEYLFAGLLLIAICVSLLVNGILKKGLKVKMVKVTGENQYSLMFLIAFILHLLFAFISSGNAEFMVMLPFLIVLYFGSKYRFENMGLVKYGTVILFIWNMCVSILPNAFLQINKVDPQVQTTIHNKEAYFIWKNKPLVENRITYERGFNQKAQYLNAKTIDKNKIDSLLAAGKKIYTDYPNTGSGYSRESYLSGNEVNGLLLKYRLLPADSFPNLYGKNYIYLIR